MTPELNKQVEETMTALDDIKRINAPESFFTSVVQRVSESSSMRKSFSVKTAMSMAAAFVLLITLNVFSWVSYHSSIQTTAASSGVQSVADDYGLTNSTYNY